MKKTCGWCSFAIPRSTYPICRVSAFKRSAVVPKSPRVRRPAGRVDGDSARLTCLDGGTKDLPLRINPTTLPVAVHVRSAACCRHCGPRSLVDPALRRSSHGYAFSPTRRHVVNAQGPRMGARVDAHVDGWGGALRSDDRRVTDPRCTRAWERPTYRRDAGA